MDSTPTFKKGDVIVDHKGRFLHVGGTHKDGAETFVLARLVGSRERLAIPATSCRLHPLFS